MIKEGTSEGLVRAKLAKIDYEEKQEIDHVLTEKQLRVRAMLRQEAAKKLKIEALSKNKAEQGKSHDARVKSALGSGSTK